MMDPIWRDFRTERKTKLAHDRLTGVAGKLIAQFEEQLETSDDRHALYINVKKQIQIARRKSVDKMKKIPRSNWGHPLPEDYIPNEIKNLNEITKEFLAQADLIYKEYRNR